MAAAVCYACEEPILCGPVNCVFCPKLFHAGCVRAHLKSDVGFVCNFGCRQAYSFGRLTRVRLGSNNRMDRYQCPECGNDRKTGHTADRCPDA